MQVYTAPLRDMRFVLNELHADDGFGNLAAFAEVTPDLVDAVLDEAAKFTREVILPTNRAADEAGCTLINGQVHTPAGFKETYKAYVEAGWGTLTSDPKWGGQGMPEAVAKLVEEMLCSANVAFGLYPGLTHGGTIAISSHATPDLQAQFLPKMVSGEWAGTMCLTEAHCGTDLGMLRTHAEPQADGSYRLTGAKIFISSGDHDLTDNIVHLVLAKLPDAPKGSKGISLFIVPKFLPDADGKPGARNGVTVTAIEHKMGIKASATCQLSFENAVGWLVGEPNAGLTAMFTMMNTERLSVGIQGLGIAEAAYQSAVWYAKDRVQGRSLAGPKRPDLPADPIIVHPDVRRMLMTMRASNEGCRALAGWVARALDAEAHGTPDQRAEAESFVALMTPVVKALFTDIAFDTTNLAVQVYGGHGYIRESGVEQYVRDARICQIYEGTNGIQALDLVGRKLPAQMGRNLRGFFHPVAEFIEANKSDGPLSKMIGGLERAFGALQLATQHVAQKGMADPEEAGAAAAEYLRLLGLVAIAYCFAKASVIALPKLAAGGDDAEFYASKLATARFYFERILPQAGALLAQIKAGKAAMMALDEAAF